MQVNFGATTLAWDIASNALITANINMASSAVQGRDMEGILKSGAVGLAAGGIGGWTGNLIDKEYPRFFSSKAIKTTNYVTAGLNGFGDRYVYSRDRGNNTGHSFVNGLIGAGEGLYLAHFWGNKQGLIDMKGTYNGKSVTGLTGRYLSSALTQAGTSFPGFGMSLASWHAGAFIAENMYVNGFFHDPYKWYNAALGVGGLLSGHGLTVPMGLQIWMQENDYYPAVVFPFLLNFDKDK